ncbi:MAG: alpha/beta hydrolase family protein [Bacteroidales bacterium]
MRNILFSLLVLGCSFSARASRVDTIAIKSNSMDKMVKIVTIVPDVAMEGARCPVVYLLHGYSGNHHTWINIKPELTTIADREGIIFICPNGENSWYWDSPKNPQVRYETFISSELIDFADSTLPTISDRKARAITGLSMGGHGALWNAIRHKNIFGAAGSTSGGVDIRPFPKNWQMKEQLGPLEQNKEVWDAHTVINQVNTLKDGELALIIDCGSEDFFLEVNNKFHEQLTERKISHDYLTRPGAHNHVYWNNSIDYQILFFSKYFNNK